VPQIISFCSISRRCLRVTSLRRELGRCRHRRNPPLWMKPGDVLEVEISGIGTLRCRVVDERA
jgi:2-keto-4-pentenoate hydratase/2-oxohepta-3-ene-1,7-dioic acid hydratase in catechol pathway